MKTKWTKHKLQRLFEYYKIKYWDGKLHNARVVIKALEGSTLGECSVDPEAPTNQPLRFLIKIDVDAHKTDSEVRSTLLHECCHVKTCGHLIHHGAKFGR